MNAVVKNGLKYGFLAGNSGASFEENLKVFKEYVALAASYNPEFVNCHSGKDFFTFEQNKQFINFTIKTAQEADVPIYHETHRAKNSICGAYSQTIYRTNTRITPNLRYFSLDLCGWFSIKRPARNSLKSI